MRKVYIGYPSIRYVVKSYDIGRRMSVEDSFDGLGDALRRWESWVRVYGGASLYVEFSRNGNVILRVPVTNNGGTFPLFMEVSNEFLLKLREGG